MDNEKLNNLDNVDEDNLITLTDENGEEVEFEIITDYEKGRSLKINVSNSFCEWTAKHCPFGNSKPPQKQVIRKE